MASIYDAEPKAPKRSDCNIFSFADAVESTGKKASSYIVPSFNEIATNKVINPSITGGGNNNTNNLTLSRSKSEFFSSTIVPSAQDKNNPLAIKENESIFGNPSDNLKLTRTPSVMNISNSILYKDESKNDNLSQASFGNPGNVSNMASTGVIQTNSQNSNLDQLKTNLNQLASTQSNFLQNNPCSMSLPPKASDSQAKGLFSNSTAVNSSNSNKFNTSLFGSSQEKNTPVNPFTNYNSNSFISSSSNLFGSSIFHNFSQVDTSNLTQSCIYPPNSNSLFSPPLFTKPTPLNFSLISNTGTNSLYINNNNNMNINNNMNNINNMNNFNYINQSGVNLFTASAPSVFRPAPLMTQSSISESSGIISNSNIVDNFTSYFSNTIKGILEQSKADPFTLNSLPNIKGKNSGSSTENYGIENSLKGPTFNYSNNYYLPKVNRSFKKKYDNLKKEFQG